MKKIYLVRHGETDSNIGSLVQGSDSVLSEHGHEQAKKLATRICRINFQHLLVSDYVRTRQTVSYALPLLTIEPEYTALVRETRQPSVFVGTTNTSVEYQEYYKTATDHIHDPNWRHSDEETFFDVLKRVEDFIDEVKKREGDVLVVTHGRFIMYVVMYILTEGKLTYETWLACRHGFETTNTGITVIKHSERFNGLRLLTFNDQSHFAE